MSTAEQVRSIVCRAIPKNKLNILVIGATHERYEETLAKTGHNFYCFNIPQIKTWNKSYAKIPKNYIILDHIPHYIDYDLILCHASDQRLNIAAELRSKLNIPILRHTHTLPYSQDEIAAHHQFNADTNSFISKYSMKEWGYNDAVINHGLDTDFWAPLESTREKVCLSVVNFWKDRDWACGWNLWNSHLRPFIPTKVMGDNPGLSNAPKNIEELKNTYCTSLIFLNTSLHSPVPMSLMEAMSCGCIVVSTGTCMIPEIIRHGYNGFLCDNEIEFRTIIGQILDSPNEYNDISLNARATIETKYNLTQFVDTWNTILHRTLYK